MYVCMANIGIVRARQAGAQQCLCQSIFSLYFAINSWPTYGQLAAACAVCCTTAGVTKFTEFITNGEDKSVQAITDCLRSCSEDAFAGQVQCLC